MLKFDDIYEFKDMFEEFEELRDRLKDKFA